MRSQAPLQLSQDNHGGCAGTFALRALSGAQVCSRIRAPPCTQIHVGDKKLLHKSFIYRFKRRSDELFLGRQQPSCSAVDQSCRMSSPGGKPSSPSKVWVFGASCSAICVQSCLCRSQLASYSDLVFSRSTSESCVFLSCNRAGWESLLPILTTLAGSVFLCVSNRDAIRSYCRLLEGGLISPDAFGYQHRVHLLNEASCFTVKGGRTGK